MKKDKPRKKRENKYETKVKIEGSFDEILKVLITSPPPNLKKRKGNKPKKTKAD